MSAGSDLVPSPARGRRPGIQPSTPEQVEYEAVLARSPGLELLGLPRDWSAVKQGFHPFSPERVVILPSNHPLGLGRTLADAQERIWSGIKAWHSRIQGPLISSVKFDLLLALVDHMAAYYQRPDLAEYWASRLACREQLGSSGLGRGFGLVHQYQLADVVKTTNAKVDWWLFLLPEGANYESLDDKPVHLLIGHVFDQRRFGWEDRVWGLTAGLARNVLGLPENTNGINLGLLNVARMDRVSAARFLNHRLALCLKDETGW